ncbi:MAG TPA: copper amine oxidase N-terminal domain-containing protein [Fimbriimonas sp.]|nr:copper amine oxidase N-terminal domain-containing protein [Fimbriimonas sp.]
MKYGHWAALLIAAGIITSSYGQEPIRVVVNGGRIRFQGQQPIMSNDRVLVPLRGVLEHMGARVSWNPSNETVSAVKGYSDVKLRIGETTASIDGNPVSLDVPAQILNGSTMVPLRFVGEALGEDVQWQASRNLVNIVTGNGYAQKLHDDRPPAHHNPATEALVFEAGAVLPVTLDEHLSSATTTRGDTFSTTIDGNESGLPTGTQVTGYVAAVRPQGGSHPGMLELRFDHIKLPDGQSYPISGSLIGLDNKSVIHNKGKLFATRGATNRGAYAGYGAGAGLIVGLIANKPLEDTAIGGLLGYLAGSLDRSHPRNVELKSGTEFGVRINKRVAVMVNR